MPKSVLTRKRSMIARFAVLAMVFSLMAVALPASAHSVALDTTGPCPAATPSAGFNDIGSLDATTQNAINCLFAFGITTGTSATTYSPNDTITRWQMALFLVRQAADHGITIPAATSQGYTDIGGFDTATQNAINQITQLGISKGTSSSTFSPNDGVTRWQMALFIYRTGLAAGVTFNNNTGHNEFADILTLSAEAQTAINALADTRADPEGHIALGTGLSLFAPNLVLVRWQMALFLTRLLAADNVAAPVGVRVTVTPTEAATQAGGTARAYTATFRNVDGTPYTGPVGITLRQVTSGTVQYDNDPAVTAVIESSSDSLTVVNAWTRTGFAGTDGVVTFVVRHAGASQTVVPIAWQDLDGLGDPEITGNAAPTEPFGLGGTTTFGVVAATECTALTGTGGLAVTAVDKAGDRYEAAGCSLYYDSNDLFANDSGPTDLAGFEAALNTGDTVTSTYNPDAAGQSTFNITDDTDPAVTVTSPASATSTAAFTFTVTGTASPGYTVRIYKETVAHDGTLNAGEPLVASGTAGTDGAWSLVVPLTSGANDFIATQRQPGTTTDVLPYTNVPTITQGTTGVSFTSTTLTTSVAPADTLSPGDVVTIVFSGDITGVGTGDTLSVTDVDGTTATLTCATNVTCDNTVANTLVVTVTAVIPTLGGTTGGINGAATITAVSGFTSSSGLAIAMTGDRTFELA